MSNLPIALLLPYPPSKNERYQHYSLTKKVKEYREFVTADTFLDNRCNGLKTITEDVFVVIYAYPPKNNKRDVQNCIDELFDSLEKSGILRNDKQSKSHTIHECAAHPSDAVFVEIWPKGSNPAIVTTRTLEQCIFDAKMHEELTGKVFAAKLAWKRVALKEKILKDNEYNKRYRKK